MKRGALAALLAAAALLLAGCSMDVDAYLIPPKLQGEEQQIQQALDEFIQTRYGKGASTNYTLKYPKGGEYTSAFILTDLNSGRLDTASKQSAANDVALAFYQVAQKGAAANTHINLLRQTDGDWTSVSDVEGLSTDIERVVFGDLDGDGIEGADGRLEHLQQPGSAAARLLPWRGTPSPRCPPIMFIPSCSSGTSPPRGGTICS